MDPFLHYLPLEMHSSFGPHVHRFYAFWIRCFLHLLFRFQKRNLHLKRVHTQPIKLIFRESRSTKRGARSEAVLNIKANYIYIERGLYMYLFNYSTSLIESFFS